MIFDMGAMIVPPQPGTLAYNESKKETMSNDIIHRIIPVTDSKLTKEDWLEILNVKMNNAQDVLSRKAPLHAVWMDADQFLSVSVTVEDDHAEYTYRLIENNFEYAGSQRFDFDNDVDREYAKLFNNFLFDAESFGDLKYATRDGTGVHKE